jgi:hypothetical protein
MSIVWNNSRRGRVKNRKKKIRKCFINTVTRLSVTTDEFWIDERIYWTL